MTLQGKHKNVVLFLVVAVVSSAAAAEDFDCTKFPSERVDPHTCCAIPDLITDEVKEKCKEFMPSGPPPDAGERSNGNGLHHHKPHHHMCIAECFYNQTGIVVNNEVNKVKLQEYLEVVFKDAEEVQPIVEQAFETCEASAAEFKTRMEQHMQNRTPPPNVANDKMRRPPCGHGGNFLMSCVFKQTFNNCPASKWNDSQPCNDFRDFMQNCGKEFGGPHGKWHKRGPGKSAEKV